jgi:uncharacterized protein (TIGR03118 family)
MNIVGHNRANWSLLVAGALLLAMAPLAKSGTVYVQTNLVSDVPGLAVTTDPNLVNPWGIANSATSPYWISDQGTGVSTLYNGFGAITPLVVTIPAGGPPSGPTGDVFNSTGAGFLVAGTSARFIFATLSGTIAGWAAGTTATTEVPATGGAVFTGLALANNGSGNLLYAADFVKGGGIQVFDSNWNPTTVSGSFTDPNLPAGYAPYNVQVIGGQLYVEYAEVGTMGPTTGAGLGLVDVFDTNGNFVQRLVSGGALNAPWGVTLAPAGFGSFGGDLLVGNFGDGTINAFNPTTGAFIGTVDGAGGTPLVNSGLWALEFGNGSAGSNPNALYFTAGIDGEAEGLFGAISATPEPGSMMLLSVGLLGIAGAMWKRFR